jgi:acyl-CoA reductase-like NAD-dependent aldehyde dehydrogenase
MNAETLQAPREVSAYTYKQRIGRDWCDASNGGTWEVVNPATEEVVRTVPFGDGNDCCSAIEAAATAFPSWSRRTPYDRGTILKRAAELIREYASELAHITVLESGKPLVQAVGEWLVSADLFEWFAEEGKRANGRVVASRNTSKRLLVLRQPLGVVGIITAWNFPAYNVARASAAALAAGCTIVLRPSEYTPLTAMAIVNVLVAAGTPEGVVNLVNGDPQSMGHQMLDHPACAKIHFTGSKRVGKLLMNGASKTITRLSLELGGNAPVLIFPGVDLESLATGAVAAKFRNSGQVCIAPQRFLVHRSIADEFVERVSSRAAALKVGNGLKPETNVGPLINANQRDRVATMVEEARRDGASIRTGGTSPDQRGYFYSPTVITDLDPSAALYREEIFGPVLPVSSFADTDEVITQANSSRYGLAAYVWTKDLKTAVHAYERLEFGMIGVNEWTPQATEAPFVGWKESGLGRESGAEGLEEYLETKLVALGGME